MSKTNDRVKQILLVEPEGVVAEVTAFRLELLGYRVSVVPSAEEALAMIAGELPDLIILDLVLPALDGTGLIEMLASDETTSEIPIIVLSVDADLDRVQAVYNMGASDFLVVPYHPEVLEEKVARHLAKRREKKDGKGGAGPAKENAASTKVAAR